MEQITNNNAKIHKIKGNENPADIFTKPLSEAKHSEYAQQLMDTQHI